MSDRTVLVTGANGFIGRHLCAHLAQRGLRVVGAIRHADSRAALAPTSSPLVIGDIADAQWEGRLSGVNAVVHLAARVHVRERSSDASAAEFHRQNVLGTAHLAEAAVKAGIETFILLSSAGVAGPPRDRPYDESETPQPQAQYARAKLAAEIELARIAEGSTMRAVSLRPPMVYGPDAPGSFGEMLAVLRAARGVPLPLGRVHNLRSFMYVENLVDAISATLGCPDARGCYYVSDSDDQSTSALMRLVADAAGVRVRLFPLPVPLLRAVATAVGAGERASKLLDSFRVSPARFTADTGWVPRLRTDAAIRYSFASASMRTPV